MRESYGARSAWLALVSLLVITVAIARPLHAQRVSGTVRDSASQQPLPGAVVLLLDPTGKAAARTTTDPSGKFRLASKAGRLRLRVMRMGFRPQELPVGGATTANSFDITLVSFPVVLEQVDVVVAPSCPMRPDRPVALAVLAQARTALFATVLARSRTSATITRLLYKRRLEGASGRTLGLSVQERVTSAAGEPFSAARSAALFNRDGFVEDNEGSHAFVGPNAETLIDDAFTESYCFSVKAPDPARPRQVGLGFEPPANEDEGRIDLVGTLWVDTLSRVLRDLSFKYVGLDRQTSALKPEGRLSFRELSNGVVIIDHWSLHLARDGDGGGPAEIGGEVARASWPDGFSWKNSLGSMRLHAVNSQGRPAAASSVQLVGTHYRGTTDASGSFDVAGLLPGPYTVLVLDPRLATLDVSTSAVGRFTAVRDSVADVRVQVESAEEFVGKRCSRAGGTAREAWVLGRAVTPDGRPVKEARWTIRDEFGSAITEGRADDEGLFQWCQLPLNKRIAIDVWQDARRANVSQILSEPLTTLRFVLP